MKHTIADYEKAIRYHRQNVFNEKNGDKHEKAIIKLKNSKVMQAVYAENKRKSEQRHGDMLLRTFA